MQLRRTKPNVFLNIPFICKLLLFNMVVGYMLYTICYKYGAVISASFLD